MKKITLLFLTLLLVSKVGLSQSTWWYLFDFDTPILPNTDTLYIDTTSNHNNIWQIGQPNKLQFQSSYSMPNAIVTKLDTVYPINDTSSFILRHIADYALNDWGVLWLDAMYKVNTDSLLDFGTIEFSPDNGLTWIDLLTDTFYMQQYIFQWTNGKPVFTGNSNGWQWFNFMINDFSHSFNIHLGDTVLLKFKFISDSIQTNKDGWMLDDINLNDWYERIPENINQSIFINASPNPFYSQTSIVSNIDLIDATLELYNSFGMQVKYIKNISGKTITLQRDNLPCGLYFMVVKENNKEIILNKLLIVD